jgi:exodeoxyribonuclease-3
MPIRIATWNINSLRLRIEAVSRFEKAFRPDVFCFQEIKCREAEFPYAALKAMGYDHFAVNAQKGYHGVAIASRFPLHDIESRDFCDKGEARHVSATVQAEAKGNVSGFQIHNFYVPAGGDVADPETNPKFKHKLQFLEEMQRHFSDDAPSSHAILVGDLNVAPLENDVWSHKALLSVVSHTPQEVERLNAVFESGGWTDPVRRQSPEPERVYTWWSYRSPNWALANKGRRLDHIWIRGALSMLPAETQIVRETRGWDRPSDHVPVLLDLR